LKPASKLEARVSNAKLEACV